jgi:hypothetical protein
MSTHSRKRRKREEGIEPRRRGGAEEKEEGDVHGTDAGGYADDISVDVCLVEGRRRGMPANLRLSSHV